MSVFPIQYQLLFLFVSLDILLVDRFEPSLSDFASNPDSLPMTVVIDGKLVIHEEDSFSDGEGCSHEIFVKK